MLRNSPHQSRTNTGRTCVWALKILKRQIYVRFSIVWHSKTEANMPALFDSSADNCYAHRRHQSIL